MPLRLVVLVSGSGTLLQSLLDAQAAGSLAARVVAVGSDRADAHGLVRAERAGVPTFVQPLAKGSDRAVWDAELARTVARFSPDLVVSAGFMKLVGPAFLTRFAMVNTHPALLPSFPGMHGVADALAHGVKVTGATLFAVDEGVDTGRILAQEAVPVLPDDTVETLHERIKVVERRLLVDWVNEYAQTVTIPEPDEGSSVSEYLETMAEVPRSGSLEASPVTIPEPDEGSSVSEYPETMAEVPRSGSLEASSVRLDDPSGPGPRPTSGIVGEENDD